MKRSILPALLLMATLPACAQKLSADKVPAAVTAAFKNAHPTASGKWEKENSDYEVGFSENGKEMSCVINAAGTILETETDITVAELPQGARDYITQHHAKAKIKEAAKIVKANGEVLYEAEVNKEDLIFDTKGQFVKTVKEAEEKD